ncbi:MAG: FadR family transcriptional regulator [Candidatus Aminicenantes bacterium]|nr:FadR family transcriptional regulator [Candidatus Aminicenantes bacterium]
MSKNRKLLKPAINRRLSEDIISQIRDLIVNGKLTAGEKIPSERELAETFGVGRPAVREALNSLKGMGLIEIKQGKGIYVKEFTYDSYVASVAKGVEMMLFSELISLSELSEVRKLIEPEICFLAAQRATKDDLASLEQILNSSTKSIDNPREYVKYSAMFHSEIARITKNKVMQFLIEGLLTMLLTKRKKMNENRDFRETRLRSHKEILEHMKSGDKHRAKKAYLNHLESSYEYYRDHFK